jgi:hypothetical protein
VELAAVSEREAEALGRAAGAVPGDIAAEARRIRQRLRSRDAQAIEEALRALALLQDSIGERLRQGGLDGATAGALRDLASRAAGAGAGLSRELAAAGVEIEPLPAAGAEQRIARAASAARESGRPEAWPRKPEVGAAVSPADQAAAAEAFAARRWDVRYDGIVRRYYEERP